MPLTLDPLNSIGAVARRRLLGEPEPPYSGDAANQVPGLQNMRPQPTLDPGPGPSTAPVTVGAVGGGGGGPVGVGTAPLGAGVPRWATWEEHNPNQPISEVAAAAMKGHQLSANPQLPAAPLGAFTDSTFEASNAVLQQQINAAYQDILQQTGYDVGGKHIPGEVEQQAARKERDYLTGMTNASNDVTGRMQQAGTIFSGYHAGQRAEASQPFVTGLGDLAIDTPKTLAGLVEKSSDLMREYAVQRNLLLQQATDRETARLAALKAGQTPAAYDPVNAPYGLDANGKPIDLSAAYNWPIDPVQVQQSVEGTQQVWNSLNTPTPPKKKQPAWSYGPGVYPYAGHEL